MTRAEAIHECSALSVLMPEPNATGAEAERGKKLRARIAALNAFIDGRAPAPGQWEPPAITPERKAELSAFWKSVTIKQFKRAAKFMAALGALENDND